jgi:Cu(I)/Ag(I) efflux system membrane fusion protein
MQAVTKLTQSNRKVYLLDAVIREENHKYIWVEKSHGLFENVMVETGVEANGMVEITSKWIVQKKSLLRGLCH